jgi:hypothetical protein
MGGVNNDWLSQLAPAHAPLSPGWWPLAPGWWVLLSLLLIVAATLIFWFFRPHTRLRRLALRELKSLQKNADDDAELARDLEHLMRRYAVARFGRDQVSGLSGERWLNFVVEHGGTSWAGTAGSNLLCLAYGGEAAAHRVAWLSGAKAFIRGRT